MNRKITIKLFVVLFVASVLIMPTAAGAPTTSRSMPASVNVNEPFTVSMTVADYGSFGMVVETIPAGFIYVESSLGFTQAEDAGSTVRFSLLGESSFDYTLIAPSSENSYTFSGIIKDDYKNEFTIGGDTSILIVESGAPTNYPTPDEQTIESESTNSETINENPDESVESENSVDDTSTESSKSVNTNPSTESTEDIPESEATPFITTFGMIVIGVIATLVHKLKK